MAFKNTQNIFSKGMNMDNDLRVQSPDTYRNASNITLTGDGDFYVAKNIAGSSLVQTITTTDDTNINVLGAFECNGTYGNDKHPSIVMFVHFERLGTPTDEIILYNIETDTKYTLLSVASGSTAHEESLDFPAEGTIDAVVFGENNVDKIYFDDHVNPLRSFDITSVGIPNAKSLTTQPLAPVDKLEYKAQRNGSGQLASGSYNISYRYYNTDTKKYSTWSPLTNSIPIYPLGYEDVTELDEMYGGVPNEVTKKSIVLSIDKTSENSLNFNAVQLGIIKNISGLKQPNTVANLTSVNTEWYDNPSEIIYDGGGLEEAIDSQELVTEDAAIKAAKTLVAKDNVLFRGNIEYHDRLVEDITFSDAKTITKKIGGAGSVFNPIEKNTNNPSVVFNPVAVPFAGTNFRTDIDGTPFETKLFRVRAGDVTSDTGCDGEPIGGGSVNHDIPTSWMDIAIPDTLIPGNVIWINYHGDIRGMLKPPGESEYFISQFYHNSSNLETYNMLVNNCDGFTGTSAFYTGLAPEFRYIVQINDTPESIARNIANQLQAVSPANFIDISFNGPVISFDAVDIVSDATADISGATTYKYMFDIEVGTLNGVNTTISNPDSVLDDLRDNDDSIEGGYTNPNNVVNTKGYFRDEVYRFGLTYMDKYGNWSRPVPFNFSEYKATKLTGVTYDVSNIVAETKSFTTNGTPKTVQTGNTIITTILTPTEIEVGDLVYLDLGVENKQYAEVRGIIDGKTYVVEGLYTKDVGYASNIGICIGGEYSWSNEGIDWKFPKRGNGKFPMLSLQNPQGEFDESNTYIQPLGLQIDGVTNHPDWAVALSVVRVRRLKNILWQSPLIATNAYMPALLQDQDVTCATPIGGSSPIGTYGPKSFAKGRAYNIVRDTPKVDDTYRGVYREYPTSGNVSTPKLAVCVPPEYMYQNDGVNYGEALTLPGAELQIIDIANIYRTEEFDVDGDGADNGFDSEDRIAFGLRADNAVNYYYNDINGVVSVESYDYKQEDINQLPDGGKTLALFYGQTVNLGGSVSLPTTPADQSFKLKEIASYGDLEATSLYNCSNEVSLQKGIAIQTKNEIGDMSYYTVKDGSLAPALSVFNFTGNSVRGNNFNVSEFYDLSNTAFRITLTSVPSIITTFGDGATSSVPIVNLVRNINDDRYGTEEDVHQFISTGVYETISSSSDIFNIEVWGGDCFVSKHSTKINDTVLDVVNIDAPDVPGDDGGKIFAYNDFQEVLVTYVESEVNCDLQASQFSYPVLKTQSLQPFQVDFDYTYNPGYSVENELKVWTSVSNVEENRLEYPARIIYSDQKVFQTDIEGFDRYRALSFYDLPEDYRGITKLTKLANDNVYVIQESAVSVLPINKNVIEDSLGGEIIVNSNTLINTPTYLLNKNGSQHIRSVKNSDSHIFFMDVDKREVFKIGGGNDGKISDTGMYSSFLSDLETFTNIPDYKIVSGYDLNNNEYWIGANSYNDYNAKTDTVVPRDRFLKVWSDKIGAWTTSIDPSENTEIRYMLYSNSLTYILGTESTGEMALESMYTDEIYGRLLGDIVRSSIGVVVNPDEPLGKTFDVLRIDSNNRLDEAIATVFKESGVSQQTTTLNLNRKPRHDGYEVPMLLDTNNSRLRGKYCLIDFYMNNGDNRAVNVSSIMTKYRLSARVF